MTCIHSPLPENGELPKTIEQPAVAQAPSHTPWLTILHWFDSWAGIENMKTDAAPPPWTGCGPFRSSRST